MPGTIRTIQRQAGQALPTCAQPNHNLMNTLGTVCSKLLPVGARATGNSPLPLFLCPPRIPTGHGQTLSLLSHTVGPWNRKKRQQFSFPACTVKPPTTYKMLNWIKISISALSTFQKSAGRPSCLTQPYKLHMGRYGLAAEAFMCWRLTRSASVQLLYFFFFLTYVFVGIRACTVYVEPCVYAQKRNIQGRCKCTGLTASGFCECLISMFPQLQRTAFMVVFIFFIFFFCSDWLLS